MIGSRWMLEFACGVGVAVGVAVEVGGADSPDMGSGRETRVAEDCLDRAARSSVQ
jgi:hypothetical protein